MSWASLIAIKREAEELDRRKDDPPTACPRDGEPLEDVRGTRHCRFCGYQWKLIAARQSFGKIAV